MSAKQPGQAQEAQEAPLEPPVTPELFREWRSPRFCFSNPERMNNPVWEWLIRSKLSAYQATERFLGPPASDAGPGWCFDRFGQSSTQLPDGRTVLISGEHEDSYDPDFDIYNDVVIVHPDGKIDIFGYPREVFPPTDFHTATFAGNRIIIIGNLGYPDERKPGITPVLALDLELFVISKVGTVGVPPGWLHRHSSVLSEDGASILIRQGQLDRGGAGTSLIENIDDWKLHLADWRWERLTQRRWQRWEVMRKDRHPNHLWDIQQALWSRRLGWNKCFRDQMEELTQKFGMPPDLDLAANLFRPSLPHEEVPKVEEEYNVFRIKIEGIVVRYVADMHSIQMTAEGDLPQSSVQALASDLAGKMSALENTPYEPKQI
jgi:hypothetical protein